MGMAVKPTLTARSLRRKLAEYEALKVEIHQLRRDEGLSG